MAPSFQERVNHIVFGAPGRASSVSGPDRELESNIQYLKAIIDALQLGQAIYYRDAAIDPALEVGMPVYYNAANARFEAALAASQNDPATGTIVAADSADVWGIIAVKRTSSTADILLSGVAEIDISAAVDSGVSAGRYYLSAAQAGMLVQQRPAVSVFVLRSTGGSTVMVNPQIKDFLEAHIHVQMALPAVPAGNCIIPAVGEKHVITVPDDSIRGWLPANHSSFGGRAPALAKFGYNLAAHPQLQSLWPPIPIEAVLLEMERSDSVNGQNQVYGRVSGNLVQFDVNGIWWMSDCYNEAPWPVDCSTEPGSESSSLSLSSVCPTDIYMAFILSFVQMAYTTG
jgi:hypothetical protein